MKTDFNHKNIIKVLLITFVFSLLIFMDSAGASSKTDSGIIEFEKQTSELSPDSPFLSQEPMIDEEAASVEKEDAGKENYQIILNQNGKCSSLPENIWVFLLGVYVFLIIFNLSYKFEEEKKIRFFWEAFYTVLALLAWYQYDACRTNAWFAQSVILIGIIIYSFYLYNFNQLAAKPEAKKEESEKTAKLPLE